MSCQIRVELQEPETVHCPSCKGNVQVKVFGCPIHGKCTVSKDVGYKVCNTCSDRVKWPTETIAYNLAKLDVKVPRDVLQFCPIGMTKGWQITKNALPTTLLEEKGISAVTVSSGTTLPQLRDVIDYVKPKLVINRAFCYPAEFQEVLCKDYPNTQFLAICHSSIGDLARHSPWISQFTKFNKLSKKFNNIILGCPDPRAIPYAQYIPNVVEVFESIPRTKFKHLAVICAARPLKNVLNQLIAAKLIQQETGCNVTVSFQSELPGEFKQWIEMIGLNYEFRLFSEFKQYINWLYTVDIVMQVSYTESFNYVAIEAMMTGAPVVGTESISFLPDDFWCFPNNPIDIATAVVEMAERIEENSKLSIAIANRVANENNLAFTLKMKELIKQGG